jgi:glycerate 2-kinase
VTARDHAEAILRAAITAAAPAPLVRNALAAAPELDDADAIHLIAIGKAAGAMAAPAFELCGSRLERSLVIAPAGTPDARADMFGAHPLPDESSRAAGDAVRDVLRGASRAAAAGANVRVLVLLSGGASAVVALPLADIAIDEYADCVARLMRAGADIGELNIVRKHIDALKGGRMAALAAPAPVLGLVLSDVVGDPLETIASGPLSPDPSTCDDALRVLRRHGVLDDCAAAIRDALGSGDAESPEPDDTAFDDVRVRIVGGNDVAINGAAAMAERLGYRVRRAVEPVTGPAREAGVTLAREALRSHRDDQLPTCIVAGGETTVAVQGAGRGGRNQEVVLAACIELAGFAGIAVGAIGTDGVDGPTDAAGAVADHETLQHAAARGVDPAAALDANDSHTFFQQTGGLIITGPTGTNVGDVMVAVVQ